jgi:protein-arginine kinase activator protein McsA
MYYVFKEKQDGQFKHKGKIPKNFTNPVNMFVNREIERKIPDNDIKQELKKKINLNYNNGE